MNACWQETDKAASWESLSVPEKYRGEYSETAFALRTECPMEELEKGQEEMKGFVPSLVEQQYEPTITHSVSRD